jgi:lipid A 3-O-deacylase
MGAQWANALRLVCVAGVAFLSFCAASSAIAQQFGPDHGVFDIFDEVRAGVLYPVQDNDDSGVIVSGQLYFKSFVPPRQHYWANALLRPRIHFGGDLATGDDPINQVYGGLTWNFPIYDRFFVEASFGGTLHDGPISSTGDGLDLGCHFMFRESVGIGVDIGQHLRVVAQADHASHADLCDGGNSGITHAGIYVGYRF